MAADLVLNQCRQHCLIQKLEKMKTLIRTKIIPLFIIGVLSIQVASAQNESQPITVDFENLAEEIKELFKRGSDCTYCLKPYQFQKSVRHIVWLDEKLTRNGKTKLKKKLSKSIVAFSDNASMEVKGLSKQIIQNVKRSEAIEQLLKLQNYVATVLAIIDPQEKFIGDTELVEVKSDLTKLRTDIDTNLKSRSDGGW